MSLSTISARIDEQDKKAFDSFCSNVGLNTSTAINLFVKTVLREQKIPFEISVCNDPFYSETNINYIKKSVEELRQGQGTAHEFGELNEK